MARIRSVHPGFWTDETTVELSITARLFVIGLWNECDDQGAFEWKPKALKMRLFPVDNVDVSTLLSELEANNLVKRYISGGREFGAVRNFCRFQRPKKPNSVYPMEPELRTYTGYAALSSEPEHPISHRSSEPEGVEWRTVPPEAGSSGEKPNQMEEEKKEKEGKKESNTHKTVTNPRASGVCDDPEFQEFWDLYPKKDDKGHARRAFVSASRKASAATIVTGLRRYRFSQDPKYIPLAATWLNGERWLAQVVSLPLEGAEPSAANPAGRQPTRMSGGF